MNIPQSSLELNNRNFLIELRDYRPEDLSQFKWAGSDFYKSAWDWAYNRRELGEIEMLVATMNDFCVGRIWPDFTKKAEFSIGILWSLDVIGCLRGQGIGSWLIEQGESIFRARNLRVSEIRVDKKNEGARRLYERNGYKIVDEIVENSQFQSLDGQSHTKSQDCWILQKAL